MGIFLKDYAIQGLVNDKIDYTLDPSQITTAYNCRYKLNKLVSTAGYTQIAIDFSTIPSILANPFSLISHFLIDNTSEKAHLFALKMKNTSKLRLIKRTESGALVDLSPTTEVDVGPTIDYTYVYGSVVVNTKVGNPLILDVGATKFRLLSNWDVNIASTAKLFVYFKNFYIALSTLEGGKAYNTRIRWSNSVEGFTSDSTDPVWIDNDPRYLGGFLDLPDNIDEITCVKEFADRLIIFTNGNIYGLTLTGNNWVFAINKIVSGKGVCSENAVANYRNILVCVNSDDVYTFNGNQVQSIIENKVKSAFLGEVSDFKTIKVFKHPNDEEIFIHHVETDTIGSSRCWVYNLLGGQWSQMDIPPETVYIAPTKTVSYSTSWDESTSQWITSSEVRWSELDKTGFLNRFLYGCDKGQIFMGDFGDTFAGALIRAKFGRDRMDLSEMYNDSTYPIKYVKQIIPLIRGTGMVRIQLGASFESHTPVNWLQSFDADLSWPIWKIDTQISGRYLTYLVEIIPTIPFKAGSFQVEGFELNVTPRGIR